MKTKYLLASLITWMLFCIGILQILYADAQRKAIDDANSKQMIFAQQAKKGIENYFENTIDFVTQISLLDHVVDLDDQGREMLEFALAIHYKGISAITRMDAAGIILHTVSHVEGTIEVDISDQPHIRKVLETREVTISDVFTAIQGRKAVALHVPIFKDGRFSGTLAALIDFEMIAEHYLKDIRIGDTGYAWITSADGIELFCPVPGHIGKSVFDNCREFPSILKMAEKMLEKRSGTTTYTFDRIRMEHLEAVKKHAIYLPIEIGDTFWSIVVATSEQEILSTLDSFKNKIILVIALLFAGTGFFTYLIIKIGGVSAEKDKLAAAEKSLRTERDYIKRIMATIPAGILRLDDSGRILFANDHAIEILGLESGDIVKRTYDAPEWKITDFEGRPFPEKDIPFNAVKRLQTAVFDIRHAIERPDGARTLLSINAMPILGEHGEFDGMVASLDDITDRYLTEQNYRMLFNQMIDGFALHEIICDDGGMPVDYRFLAVNPAFERLTGFVADSLIGKTVLEVFPNTEKTWIEKYGRVALTGKPDLFESFSQELGRYYQASAFRPAANQFACIFVDVTDKKEAEKKVWESKERFEKVFNSQLDAIFVLNAEIPARIVDVNTSAVEIFGYQPNELIGKTIPILHVDAPSMAEFQRTLFGAMKMEGHLTDHRFQMKRKGGSVFPAEATVLELKSDDGQRSGWVSIVRDLTERIRIEDRLQQAQKMESIGNLAGGIAHDFNNILFPIIGLSEMLLEDLPPDGIEHGNIAEILKAGKRGSELVKQILAFSRQSEQQMIPVRPQQVLKEVTKLMRSTIPSNIKITSDLQADCGLVLADPTQLHQIAMNLVTNAYHAVERNNGSISVELKEAVIESDATQREPLPAGRYAVITVSDSGSGIEPHILEQIFEPYFTTKEKGKGTGLGLSVVYGIVKGHGGDIRVSSEPGRGATFSVYLPLMDKGTDPENTAERKSHKTGSERILLIDDEEPITRLQVQMLERLGYKVTSCVSSTEALRIFKADPLSFDLVLSDIAMPDMTGDQLARKLIDIRADVPIILCTGFSERIDPKMAAAIGIKGFLMKPVLRSKLAEMVRQVLDDARSAAEAGSAERSGASHFSAEQRKARVDEVAAARGGTGG